MTFDSFDQVTAKGRIMNSKTRFLLVSGLALTVFLGCGVSGNTAWRRPLLFHKKKDVNALVRNYVPTCKIPILEAAKCVTAFEDDLRRKGTISVKTPDVWGDSNLMHSIQESDNELAGSLSKFDESIQAFIANSDQAEVASELAVALGTNLNSAGATQSVTPPENNLINISGAASPFALLTTLGDRKPTGKFAIEPTERERQHATYVALNQAIRRRNMGGDNTRKAGYGLYMFRIPVSIIPGEETNEGYSAVASLRAKMIATKADVKYALPRMAIADLVEATTQTIYDNWDADSRSDVIAKLVAKLESALKKRKRDSGISSSPDTLAAIKDFKDKHPKLTNEQIAVYRDEINRRLRTETVTIESKTNAVSSLSKQIKSFDPSYPGQGMSIIKAGFRTHVFPYVEIDQTDQNQLVELQSPEEFKNQANKIIGVALPAMLKAVDTQGNRLMALDPFDPELSEPVPQATASGTFEATGAPQLASANFSAQNLGALREHLKITFKDRVGKGRPQHHELRKYLSKSLSQININLGENNAYDIPNIDGIPAIIVEADLLVRGLQSDEAGQTWRRQLAETIPESTDAYRRSAWLLARQCGLVDLNIKRMMKELELRGEIAKEEVACAESINFFSSLHLEESTRLWQLLIEKEFPLEVFTLEPLVEEQNSLDSLSRIREMQFALAYNVAQGGWNAQQKVAMSRQLALETAAIGVNRTMVGFAHGADTFGWYFNPRLQSPDTTQRNNVSTFCQTFARTGPTKAEDRSTYRLAPGVRECEVLIAMPSFVSQVAFDVTTNWESLANPGRGKQSYEEMIAQGCKLNDLHACLEKAECGTDCRPGDLERLRSRAEQLEKMLGMQTYNVDVPFQYDLPATELFNQGDKQLVPKVNGFYGLSVLAAKDGDKAVTAEFFVTGSNFHPTLTHVIVGGHESHSLGGGDDLEVEILSRELIRVRTELKTETLAGSAFEVRVGTPGGMSNPLAIGKKTPAKVEPSKSDFDWGVQPKLEGYFVSDGTSNPGLIFNLKSTAGNTFDIKAGPKNPLSVSNVLNPTVVAGAQIVIVYEAKFDGVEKPYSFNGMPFPVTPSDSLTSADLIEHVKNDFNFKNDQNVTNLNVTHVSNATITGTTYLRLDNWPLIKFDKTIEIKLRPQVTEKP